MYVHAHTKHSKNGQIMFNRHSESGQIMFKGPQNIDICQNRKTKKQKS